MVAQLNFFNPPVVLLKKQESKGKTLLERFQEFAEAHPELEVARFAIYLGLI